MKEIRRRFNKYINGIKGIVSIYLALTMLPFISIAAILVESVRYQHAIELVDELLDCVGLSSIADYDTYLEDRFGLLTVSQGSDYNENFKKYVQANEQALCGGFTYTDSSVTGKYALSDNSVLKNQILEYSETSTTFELLWDTFKVDDLMKELTSYFSTDKIKDLADNVKKVSDAAKSAATLIETLGSLVSIYNTYKDKVNNYNTKLNDFKKKTWTVIDEIRTEESNLAKEENYNREQDFNKVYDSEDVKDAIEDYDEAKKALETARSEASSAISDMKTHYEALPSSAESLLNSIDGISTSLSGEGDTTFTDKSTTTTSEIIRYVAEEILNAFNTYSTAGDYMQKDINALDDVKTSLNKLVCEKHTIDEEGKIYIDDYVSSYTYKSTDECTEALYIKAELNTDVRNRIDGFGNMIESIKKQAEEKSKPSEDDTNSILNVLDIADKLLDIELFYDTDLNSNVSPLSFYDYDSSDISFSNKMSTSTLKNLVDSGVDFVKDLSSFKLVSALKDAAKFLASIVGFLLDIVAWITDICCDIANFFANIDKAMENLILDAYCIYNFPSRVNYTSSSLSGYSYNKIFTMMHGTTGDTFSGIKDDINKLLQANGTGTDPGFKGAELEYLLIGDENEFLNQSATFFNVYMLRMIMDLWPVLSNGQVAAMAGAATIAGWAVYIAVIIAEPLIDTLLLVNDIDQYLVKDSTSVYCTPTGIVKLGARIPEILNVSKNSKELIKDEYEKSFGKAIVGGTYSLSYEQHVMILMWITVDQNRLLSRIKNVVQMEAAQYYKDSYTFKLNNTNTYLETKMEGKLNSMFNIESLTNGGILKINRERDIGY